MRSLFLLLSLLIYSAPLKANQQAVAAPDTFSAKVANDILLAGGNAVDAAIAVQFTLAVTFPEAGNIGGGGFMLIYKDNAAEFLDYREKAPIGASRDMYLDEDGKVIPNLSIHGILASGVPGTVSGMWEAHKKHGSLPWKDLVQPAVDLAKNGFAMPVELANFISQHNTALMAENVEVNFAQYFAHAKAGELFVQKELATVLARIRDLGLAGFYQGETAKTIALFMRNNGGLITLEDLAKYKAQWRRPIRADWRDMQILTAPPPSSGGIALVQWLSLYDMVKPKSGVLEQNSSNYIHLLAEAAKRVFADRAEFLGDPDFFDVPVEQLINREYLFTRSQEINKSKISDSYRVSPGLVESEQTTHFSIVDKWGNAVSNTTTINLGFGSSVVVEGAGFLLNNEMDDFSAKSGVSNYFGALGGTANEIQPEKRMLSSMTPSMLLKNGQVKMVTGSPGGTTIMSSVYQSMLNVIDYNMSAQKSVDAPRFHHQLWPENSIRLHPGLSENVQLKLEKMGYKLDIRPFGDLHIVIRRDGKLQAASESRGRGKAVVTEVRLDAL